MPAFLSKLASGGMGGFSSGGGGGDGPRPRNTDVKHHRDICTSLIASFRCALMVMDLGIVLKHLAPVVVVRHRPVELAKTGIKRSTRFVSLLHVQL